MSRTFSSGDSSNLHSSEGAAATWFGGLSALLVVARFRIASFTPKGSTDEDVGRLTADGYITGGGDISERAWALSFDRRTDGSLVFQVVDNSLAVHNFVLAGLKAILAENTWYTLVAAWDGTTQKMWVSNGSTATESSVPTNMNTPTGTRRYFTMGGVWDGSALSRRFDGDIAEVMIETNGTFPTDNEVNEYLKGESKAFKPNATAHWVLGDDGSLTDILGSKVLTAVGSPAVSSNHPVVWNPIWGKAQSDYFDGLSSLLVVARFSVPDLIPPYFSILCSKSSGEGASPTHMSWGLWLSIPSDALIFYFSDGTALSTLLIYTITSKISVNTWYTLVAAWDGTSQKLWLSTGDSTIQATPLATMRADALGRFAINGSGNPNPGSRSGQRPIVAEVMIEADGTFPSEARVQKLLDGLAWDDQATAHWQLRGDTYHDIIGEKDLTQPWPIKLPATHPHVYAPSWAQRTGVRSGAQRSVRSTGRK